MQKNNKKTKKADNILSAFLMHKFANFNVIFVSKNHYLPILYILSPLKALKMKMCFLIKILAISTFGPFVKDFYNFLTLKSIKIIMMKQNH